MKRESQLTRDLCNGWKALGGKVTTLAGGSQFQNPGLPDRIMSHVRCGFWFVEFKRDDGKLRPIQKHELNDWVYRGMGNVVVVRLTSTGGHGIVETVSGEHIAEFDGSALGLLEALHETAIVTTKELMDRLISYDSGSRVGDLGSRAGDSSFDEK